MSSPIAATHMPVLVVGVDADGNLLPLTTDAAGNLLPSATPSPVARSVHLASATLPAAGAYTSQSLYEPAAGLSKYVAFWATYTRGAAGGQPKFKVEWSNGTETGTEFVIGETLTISDPTATENGYLSEILGPAPADGSAITFLVVAENNIGATGVRLLAAEAGVTGTPGTCAIAITGSG